MPKYVVGIEFVVQKNILGFDIAMNELGLVQEGETGTSFADEFDSIFLGGAFFGLFFNPVNEVSAVDVFKNEQGTLFIAEQLFDGDDILVCIEFAGSAGFIEESFDFVGVPGSAGEHAFDGDKADWQVAIAGLPDYSAAACSEFLNQLKMFFEADQFKLSEEFRFVVLGWIIIAIDSGQFREAHRIQPRLKGRSRVYSRIQGRQRTGEGTCASRSLRN